MAAPCYIIWNADQSALTGPYTGTATSATAGTVKTILQLRPGTSTKARIIEWGYGFDSTPAAPVRVELIACGTIYATVTTIGTNGIRMLNDSTGSASTAQIGTTHTGFNASGEGTITATRLFAYRYDTGLFFQQQFPLGREPEIPADNSLRIRATPTTSVAVNMVAYIVWEE
jgi:hypothetical protein